jgi:glycosyltransferase involved in cell wall biosynthesis
VPSEHTKKVLKDTGDIRVPIYVIPETYHKSVENDDLLPLDLNLSTNFNFLVFAQFTGGSPNTDRKNLFNTVKWMCEIFSNDPDVGIILKTNSGCNSRIDRQITEKLLSNLLSEVRKGPYPKFHFLHGAMTEAEVAALYRVPSIKALVSLTRGEGFGLPILEAAASGLPVIATGWSGHLDFLRYGKFIAIRHRLAEIPKGRADGNIWMPNSRWAEPVEEDAKKCLVRFRKKPDIPKKWATELKKKIRQNFSEQAINNLYDNLINDLT